MPVYCLIWRHYINPYIIGPNVIVLFIYFGLVFILKPNIIFSLVCL